MVSGRGDACTGSEQPELPGAIVTYTLTITNDGNIADAFMLDVPSNTPGWPVTVPPSVGPLAADESTTFNVQVMVPAGAGGLVDTTTVTAQSQKDPGVSDSATDSTTAIEEVYDITLQKTVGTDATVCAVDNAIALGVGGGEVTYCYTVTNNGNVTLDSHDLTDSELGIILDGEAVSLAPL